MANKLTTPIDTLSGQPYLLAPFGEREVTRHHAWHPSDHEFFATVPGAALRVSVLQESPAKVHNDGKRSYHAQYAGPELPRTDAEAFASCFFAAAGAISRYCIDFSTKKPQQRPITPDEKKYLQVPHAEGGYEHIHQGYLPVREFFQTVIFDQDVRHLDSTIDQFLTSANPDDRVKAGLVLLEEAARIATFDLRKRYRRLRRLGVLYPWATARPERVVMLKLGERNTKQELLPALGQKLEAA